MPSPTIAAFIVLSTLLLVAGIVLGYFAIRRRLLDDPELQEFMERVEEGRDADAEGADAEDSGSPRG